MFSVSPKYHPRGGGAKSCIEEKLGIYPFQTFLETSKDFTRVEAVLYCGGNVGLLKDLDMFHQKPRQRTSSPLQLVEQLGTIYISSPICESNISRVSIPNLPMLC